MSPRTLRYHPRTINNDVAYAVISMPGSGTSICNQFRAVGGAGSIGVHHGTLTTSRGNVSGGWTTIYSMSSQQAFLYDKSGSQDIPFTRITDNASFANYPQCVLDLFVGHNMLRACNIESGGLGTIFWFSQDHSSYDALNVP